MSKTFASSAAMEKTERGTYCLERGSRNSGLGTVLRIEIGRHDGRRMNWEQVWRTFARNYPGMWALELFPPKEALVNEVHRYHLWVVYDETLLEPFRIDEH